MVEGHKEFEAYKKKIEQMLESDPYGGKTPEETLKLFVEALKAKDYKLASRYYVPWKWEWAEEDVRDWIENHPDGLKLFLNTYDNGYIERDTSYVVGLALEIYENDESLPYIIKMIQNEKTGLWKIEKY